MRANLPPKFANAVLRDDGRLHEFTLKVAGRRFFCDCGCNVFHKPDRSQTELYECNACGVRFISPSTRTPLSRWPHNPGEPADPVNTQKLAWQLRCFAIWLKENAEASWRWNSAYPGIEPANFEKAADQLENQEDKQKLIKELASLARRRHYYCEDSWYSCPKATDGCANDAMGDQCNCGADEHNAKVDALMQQLKSLTD